MDTLKGLAEHCYQHWLTTNQPALTPGAIEWIRNDIGEQKLSDEVRRIFTARIHGSEKCYRFLKLTGVIERDRLRRLLKKQVLDEIEVERAQRLREIEAQFHEKVNEQRQRVLKRPSEGAMPFWLLMIGVALVSAVLGGMAYASIGWSLGALVGGGVTCGYRLIRTSGLVEQFVSSAQQGLADKRRAVEVDIEDRKGHIDNEVIELEHIYNGPLIDILKADIIRPLTTTQPTLWRSLVMPGSVIFLLLILPVIFFSVRGRLDIYEAMNTPRILEDNVSVGYAQVAGPWKVTSSISVYKEMNSSSPEAFSLSPGSKIVPLKIWDEYRQVGVLKILQDFKTDDINADYSKDPDYFKQRGLKNGDVVAAAYSGEGMYQIWYRGKSAMMQLFDIARDRSKSKWLREEKESDLIKWTQIKTEGGQIGWLRMDTNIRRKIEVPEK